MADPSQAALAAPLKAGASPHRPKYRIRFQKAGDLRLVSHHDLMNCFERMIRRAEIPVAASQGFHPKPKMVFALSLALGIIGSNEVLELELTQDWSEEELLDRLNDHAPPGIIFHSVRHLEGKTSAQVCRAFYRLPVAELIPGPNGPSHRADLERRCEALLAEKHIWIERTRPHARRFDLRPLLSELRVQEGALEMTLEVTPHGTARPEEVARLLDLADLLDAGACFERVNLEMLDEALPGETLSLLESADDMKLPQEKSPHDKEIAARHREDRVLRPTPLLPGPLSFDS